MANEYFGNTSEKGIQILPFTVSDAAIGIPSSGAGIILDSQAKAIKRNFLVKKVHLLLIVSGMTAGEAVIIGINGNDSGIAGGYGSGVASTILDPEASGAYILAQEVVKTVWHETTSILLGNTVTAHNMIDKWVSVGGGKGIPVTAAFGPELHAYNPTGDTISTGGIVSGVVTYYGVWLED